MVSTPKEKEEAAGGGGAQKRKKAKGHSSSARVVAVNPVQKSLEGETHLQTYLRHPRGSLIDQYFFSVLPSHPWPQAPGPSVGSAKDSNPSIVYRKSWLGEGHQWEGSQESRDCS